MYVTKKHLIETVRTFRKAGLFDSGKYVDNFNICEVSIKLGNGYAEKWELTYNPKTKTYWIKKNGYIESFAFDDKHVTELKNQWNGIMGELSELLSASRNKYIQEHRNLLMKN